MADLVLDTAMLRDLDQSLALVLTTLRSAGSMSRSTAAAVASGGLADAIEEFAEDWEDNRDDMIEAVQAMSNMVHLVSSTFDELDQQLVASLLGGR
jgi:hypothetical protein